MRKILALVFVILSILLLLSGCEKMELKERQVETEKLTIKDYYPIMENFKIQYIGVNSHFSQKITFVEFIEGNRVQLKNKFGDKSEIKVLELKNGELREIYNEENAHHVENMLDVDSVMNNILLKEPLKVGNSWTTSDGYKRSITGVDVEIDTPYGQLKAIEVTTQYGEGKKQTDYYTKNIGHVATIYFESGFQIKTLLERVDKEPIRTSIRFYYPQISDMNTVYLDKEIEIETNTDIIRILESNMKNPKHEELLPCISKNTSINSIELDREKKIAKVDFTSEIINDMNSDNSMEVEKLKSVVNTIGNYYNVEGVYISVDGKPYNSDYFTLNEDEYFSVDYTDVEEFDNNE